MANRTAKSSMTRKSIPALQRLLARMPARHVHKATRIYYAPPGSKYDFEPVANECTAVRRAYYCIANIEHKALEANPNTYGL